MPLNNRVDSFTLAYVGQVSNLCPRLKDKRKPVRLSDSRDRTLSNTCNSMQSILRKKMTYLKSFHCYQLPAVKCRSPKAVYYKLCVFVCRGTSASIMLNMHKSRVWECSGYICICMSSCVGSILWFVCVFCTNSGDYIVLGGCLLSKHFIKRNEQGDNA